MSTPVKPSTVSATPGAARPGMKSNSGPAHQTFLFDKENYMWMIGGIALIFIGFMLMAGGKSPDPHQFHADEIYSFRRITLAPVIILLGFATEVYAIMKKPKEANHE